MSEHADSDIWDALLDFILAQQWVESEWVCLPSAFENDYLRRLFCDEIEHSKWELGRERDD